MWPDMWLCLKLLSVSYTVQVNSEGSGKPAQMPMLVVHLCDKYPFLIGWHVIPNEIKPEYITKKCLHYRKGLYHFAYCAVNQKLSICDCNVWWWICTANIHTWLTMYYIRPFLYNIINVSLRLCQGFFTKCNGCNMKCIGAHLIWLRNSIHTVLVVINTLCNIIF